MTKNETKAVKNWNIAQGKAGSKADTIWDELHAKYLKLDGYADCSFHGFTRQIATCTKTTPAERDTDLCKLIEVFTNRGRLEALFDYLGEMAK